MKNLILFTLLAFSAGASALIDVPESSGSGAIAHLGTGSNSCRIYCVVTCGAQDAVIRGFVDGYGDGDRHAFNNATYMCQAMRGFNATQNCRLPPQSHTLTLSPGQTEDMFFQHKGSKRLAYTPASIVQEGKCIKIK
jgi:hypothetical protein